MNEFTWGTLYNGCMINVEKPRHSVVFEGSVYVGEKVIFSHMHPVFERLLEDLKQRVDQHNDE